MRTKQIFFAAGLLLAAIFTNKSFASFEKKNEPLSTKSYSFVQQYNIASPAVLDILTTGGNISIEGTEGKTVEVAFVVTKRGQVLDISLKELKAFADVDIQSTSNNLLIHVNKIYERNISIGFLIKAPVKTSAELRTSGGNIHLSNLNGMQVAKTSGGNLKLEQITGTAEVKTSGGNISINDSKADFQAYTSGGNISLDNIEGRLDVATSGGNIKANNISKGLTAKSSGGSINLTSVRNQVDVSTSGGSIHLGEVSGSVKANTSGGNIKATVAKLSGGLELRTSGGSINATIPSGMGLDLDLKASRVNTSLKNFTGTSKKDRVLGQMNGGGIPVKLSTSGGSITLDFN